MKSVRAGVILRDTSIRSYVVAGIWYTRSEGERERDREDHRGGGVIYSSTAAVKQDNKKLATLVRVPCRTGHSKSM